MNSFKHIQHTLGAFALGSMLFTTGLRADQSLETLVSFSGNNGANPESVVVGPHGNFYGTTYSGGTGGKGTIFKIPLNSPIQTLVNFSGPNGANPESRLVYWNDGNFYGTTYTGGPGGKGTLFKMTPDGDLKTVVAFSGLNGASPISELVIGKDGDLYGTTSAGGSYAKGTLFKVAQGTDHFQTIDSFNGPNGANPQGLVLGKNGDFYGTTSGGGPSNDGTIFELTPDGKIRTLVYFNGANGANPHARMGALESGELFGTTYNGGANNLGTVFTYTPGETNVAFTPLSATPAPSQLTQMIDPKEMESYGSMGGPGGSEAYGSNPESNGLRTIVTFNGANGAHPDSALVPWSNGYFYFESLYTNARYKSSEVQWSGVNFCGTTSTGGAQNNGTVFQVTDTGALTTLVAFSGTNGSQLGTIPDSLSPGNDGNLYGTTYYGGPGNGGTVYRLSLQVNPPPGVAANSVAGPGVQPQASP
jgi:uncharacterized repeat protein (TIGR03803 family)